MQDNLLKYFVGIKPNYIDFELIPIFRTNYSVIGIEWNDLNNDEHERYLERKIWAHQYLFMLYCNRMKDKQRFEQIKKHVNNYRKDEMSYANDMIESMDEDILRTFI